MKRVAIVGSRDYPDLWRVEAYVRQMDPADTVVVSGGAKGVDSAAADAARQSGIRVVEYLPDWEQYGRSAGFRRNRTIVKNSDLVVAFWNGKSRGTASTISIAKEMGKPFEVMGTPACDLVPILIKEACKTYSLATIDQLRERLETERNAPPLGRADGTLTAEQWVLAQSILERVVELRGQLVQFAGLLR